MSETSEPVKLNPYFSGPVWAWFSLSYSNYLVLPRSLMQGMPLEWQEKMVALLDEMRDTYDVENDDYEVHLMKTLRWEFTTEEEMNETGRDEKPIKVKVTDPLADYRHPVPLPYRTTPSAQSDSGG